MPEPRVGRWLIYGLIDPTDGTLLYVGKTHKKRELRLQEHIDSAMDGSTAPIHRRIRKLIEMQRWPNIFVLKRVSAELSWREAERFEIRKWKNYDANLLPTIIPPQTPKSVSVSIRSIDLLNVRNGG